MTVASQSLRLAEITFASKQRFRYVYTVGGFKVCGKCCGTERKKFAVDPLWLIKADNVNKTPYSLKCDNCGSFIVPRQTLQVIRSLSRNVAGKP
jgi:hypothetical protein